MKVLRVGLVPVPLKAREFKSFGLDFNWGGFSHHVKRETKSPHLVDFSISRKRAEYCFESTVSEMRTQLTEPHWVLRQTRWVLRKARWVRFGTQIKGWEELTEFAPRNSVSPKKLTEFGIWNRTLRKTVFGLFPNFPENLSRLFLEFYLARQK